VKFTLKPFFFTFKIQREIEKAEEVERKKRKKLKVLEAEYEKQMQLV
jgi:hypothetical protein